MPGFLEGAVMRPPDFLLATIKPKSLFNQQFGLEKVGATGFEPATAWSQTRSATGLRYTPNAFLDGNAGAKLQISFGTYKF